jgi:DNA-binding NarL/FixJ family response regulator
LAPDGQNYDLPTRELSAGGSIRILLADDQSLQREGYRMVLESQPDLHIVGEASDGAQALALARMVQADVVLMDIQMPRVNGIMASERIMSDPQVLAFGRPPRIILLTAVDRDDYVPAASAAGAFTVLYKDVQPEMLLDAIRDAASSRGAE